MNKENKKKDPSCMYVEYLAVVEKTNTFCDSGIAFTKLMQVDSTILISGSDLKYKDTFQCQYLINSGEVEGKDQRFFHLEFSIKRSENSDLGSFASLLKTVRGILAKIDAKVAVLWDDMSFEYSKQAYTMVYRTENLMRKLITNFMVVKVGAHWASEATPSEVKEVITKAKREDYLNPLHNVDFIHLADYLVKPYSNTSQTDLLKQLRTAENMDDLTKLKQLLPQSNWTRYFSRIVDCEDTYLSARWTELYELRCKIAHNALVAKVDYEKIKTLSKDLNEKIEDAIRKLPQVNIPNEEVKNVAENSVQTVSLFYGNYILNWKYLEDIILSRVLQEDPNIKIRHLNVGSALAFLRKKDLLDDDDVKDVKILYEVRNFIVHPSDRVLTDFEIENLTGRLFERTKIIYGKWNRAGNI
jgi:hypothetical protein